ncbi:MAG: tetratricopeptide repeat protein [Sulfuriflexus sp.]|nr:tetratricopeptide repeat protein [Sulfuriflexus sp.]
MSVINQMLKDLEQRRAQGFDNGADMLDDLAGADGDDGVESSNKKGFWLLFGLLLIVALGVGLFFGQVWQQEQLPSPVPIAEKPKQQAPVKSVVVEAMSEPKVSLVEKETAITEPALVIPAPVKQVPIVKNEIAEIRSAEPIEAEMIISAILPSPLTATGLREIITVHGSGFIEPVKVTMEWNEGRAFKDLEPWQVKVISKTQMQLHVNLGTLPDDWRMIIAQLDRDNSAEYKFSVIAAAKKIIEVASKKSIVEKEPQEIKNVFNKKAVALSKDEQVRLAYAEASNALQQGKISDAKGLFRKVLLLDFTHIQSRQTLAALLFRDQQYDEAIEVLELARIQHPEHVSFTLLLARIHTERGQDPIAVDLLERINPDVASNSDFYALLAALYQRSAQYKNAAAVYEKLLRVYPGRAVWWMGLGLSLQSTERKQDALSAYKKALATQGLTVELKRFIQKRMQILQQE